MKDVVKQFNNALESGLAQIQDMMTSDAVKLLKMDHRKVKGLFVAYKLTTDRDTKKRLVQQICLELKVHAQVEEELVYPALRMIDKGDMLVEEANVEHGLVKDLVAELEYAPYRGTSYDAKVKVLQELVEHHVKEEEHDMLPKLKDVSDIENLAKQIEARKAELISKYAAAPTASTKPKRTRKATAKQSDATQAGNNKQSDGGGSSKAS